MIAVVEANKLLRFVEMLMFYIAYVKQMTLMSKTRRKNEE